MRTSSRAALITMPEHVTEMARLGRLRSPREACGVFARDRIIELPNRSTENDLASFTTEDLFVAFEVFDEEIGLDEMILWHTHPGGNLGPSKTDLELKVEGLRYMVVTLNTDGTHSGTSY